ncbi:MAG: divalent-cation tolerance protein CutA [Gemmatimonadota bacterium]|jgi:periplasmic divalent cation tolerance protein
MTNDAPAVQVVLVTAPDVEVADGLVTTLVDEGLAACGNIVPGLLSVFRWQGVVEREQEALVVLKTVESAVPALIRRASELHPYAVPEILVVPVETGYGPYLDWVVKSVDQG